MRCLDLAVLRQLLREGLPHEEARECEVHLKGCAPCAERYAAMRREARAAASMLGAEDVLGAEDDTSNGPTLTGAGPERPEAQVQGGSHLLRGSAIGRYLVLDKLGQGGMGEVYSAFDPQLNRRVAIKLLLAHHDSKDASAKERLLREAQAMAQLSHPNVLPVFDVGEHAGHVFIAMELVEGTTLRRWLKQTRPGWREVVRRFVDAGRGLAAAHKAGLVHRDFKPDNVLLSNDGRVYVMDFGLARAGSELSDRELGGSQSGGSLDTSGPSSVPLTHGVTGLLATHLTQHKGVIGTPGFMPPEQIANAPLDARADVFAFCASLYLSLYGQRAFAGGTAQEVLQATVAGAVQPPPRSTKVPAWLHRLVLKGLATDRNQRFPGMEVLLSALQDDPAVRARRYAIAAGVLVAFVGIAALPRVAAAQKTAACNAGAQGFSEVWSPERRSRVEQAFRATGAPYANTLLHTVTSRLDSYAQKWAAQRADACLATQVRGEASQSELALRNRCLDARRDEAQALLDVFARADAKTVEGAVSAVSKLSPLEPCADLDSLLRGVKPPASPALAATVAEGRQVLTRAKALHDAGRYPEARSLLEPWVERARTLGYPAFAAEVYALQGSILERSGDPRAARELLRDALAAAEGSNHDEVKVRAVVVLTFLYADDPLLASEAVKWNDWTQQLLGRVPHSESARARTAFHLGWVYERLGQPAKAIPLLRQAAELAAASDGADSEDALHFRRALAGSLTTNGELDEAKRLYGEIIASYSATLGARHPKVGRALASIGRVYNAEGDHVRALEVRERALSIYQGSVSPQHPDYARLEDGLAESLLALERYPEARAVALSAVEHYQSALGKDAPVATLAHCIVAESLVEQGRPAEALPYARRTVALASKLPDSMDQLRDARALLGQVLLAMGRPAEARPLLEEGLAFATERAHMLTPWTPPYARYLLARATWETRRGERAAARETIQEVEAQLAVMNGARRQHRQVVAWLASHGRS